MGQVEVITQNAIGEAQGSWRKIPDFPHLKPAYTSLLKALSHARYGGLKLILPDVELRIAGFDADNDL
ncbi:hypothetical protein [Asticcacaulis sp. EMRT-3]|uniref:hypothetical protein n=1 Tax=Asticcacaulis sp. EMRT-3 TaxID=3040349 RepID=UPI0024AEFF1D|nr:hypothetical protein [Asticcacaulis sp. EMRT-3]MDI7776380.1 hypothetical protein [Asticcacaulis sp. EMRT-3]